MKKYIIFIFFILITLNVNAQTNIKKSLESQSLTNEKNIEIVKKSLIKEQTSSKEIPAEKGIHISIITATILAGFFTFLGALIGSFVNIFHLKKREKEEYRSLIIAFGYELVFAYKRCIDNYEQIFKGEVSYGNLWDFSDATTLSRFAAVCKNPKIIGAITDLKAKFFQVRRHYETASDLAVKAGAMPDRTEREKTKAQATAAQSRANAFFISPYESIEQQMDLLLKEINKVCPGENANELNSIFNNSKVKKRNLEKSKKESTND
ncbi:MAG TPA: hypothetical protein VMW81_07385 [Nitrospinota bacterium]|nr:hypothetical protein [Nitrospinota bacterium]